MHTVNHEHLKKHIAENEYVEGPEALANFNRVATAVFQSKKKTAASAPAKAKKATSPKSGKEKA
jgi:hypothetical protein